MSDFADLLAQFPAEDPQTYPPVIPNVRGSSPEADASVLLAFASEAVVHEVRRSPLSAAARRGWSGLRRVCHGIAALGALAVLVAHVVSRQVSASAARIAAVARIVWRSSALASRIGAVVVLVMCLACASRAREFSRRVARVARVGWRTTVTSGQVGVTALRHSVGVTALRQSWHPLTFFLSGVAAGAALVTFVPVSSGTNVETVVSASAAAPAPPQEIVLAQLPRVPVNLPAQPVAVLPLDRSVPSVQPVSTSGTDTNPRLLRPRAVRATVVNSNVLPTRTEGTAPTSSPAARPQVFLGSISVGSSPEGATVFVNGQEVGTTPLVLSGLPVGSRALRLTMAGHNPWSTSVRVVADQRTTVSATLQPSPR